MADIPESAGVSDDCDAPRTRLQTGTAKRSIRVWDFDQFSVLRTGAKKWTG